jgi:hypothetical protein
VRYLNPPLCTLEPQVVAHAEEMFLVLSDPAIYEYEGQPPPLPASALAGPKYFRRTRV